MEYIVPVVIVLAPAVAHRSITLRFTRDGEQTPAIKVALLLNTRLEIQAVFQAPYEAQQLFRASDVDSSWLLLAQDTTPVARAAGRFVHVDADVIVAMDLNNGSSSGGGGVPGSIDAVTRFEGMPVSREVVALDRTISGDWLVAGSAVADASGVAVIEVQVTPSGQVYAFSPDDYGVPFQSGLSVAVGRRVRPTLYTGWLYEITEAGLLPVAEPEWWTAMGENPSRPLGTARAIAVRYHQPLAHGPLPVEIT